MHRSSFRPLLKHVPDAASEALLLFLFHLPLYQLDDQIQVVYDFVDSFIEFYINWRDPYEHELMELFIASLGYISHYEWYEYKYMRQVIYYYSILVDMVGKTMN